MGKREEEIQEFIRKKVFDGCFRTNLINKYEMGRDILYKLYLQYYDSLKNMETKRMILYNLIYSERMCKNEIAVGKYVTQLKHDMDNTENYKEKFKNDYCNMLSYYCDCEEIKLTNEEKIKYYKFCFDYYNEMFILDNSVDTFIRMSNINFNINKLQKNFKIILEIIKDIHNINNAEATSTLEQMLCDIKNIDNELYEDAIKITTNISMQYA